MSALVKCPCCNGDGKETCHNPDHGFISSMAWHDIGRLGCPVCGNNKNHKVYKGGSCEECDGAGVVHEEAARKFCTDMDYDFEEIMDMPELKKVAAA